MIHQALFTLVTTNLMQTAMQGSYLALREPDVKGVLKDDFAKAKLAAEIEVYPAAHGWCPPDTTVYNKDAAEKAWSRMLALFSKALA